MNLVLDMPIRKIVNISMFVLMANNQDEMDANSAKHLTMFQNVVNGLAKFPNGNKIDF